MRLGSNNKIKLPYKPRGELMGIVREISGGSRLIAMCEDNISRMVRIGGRLKKKMWTRVGDLVIVKKWQIQGDKKSDLVYRYTKTEKENLRRKGLIPEGLDIL
tara:strand:+ start:1028 stop:1336 length:309 start_codon:yes stop_codon:yes gene_type:complete